MGELQAVPGAAVPRSIAGSALYMRIRRRLPVIVGVLLFAAAIAVMVVLRKHAPPEPARLLPSADGFVYFNLKWVRRANVVPQLPPVSHDPEYEQFIQATGFQFERDLDQAAFAIHYPAAGTSNSGASSQFSEIFVGKLDGERLRNYLHNISHSTENYRSIDIYTIPVEGRTLRVAILGPDTVAASNRPDPEVIRGIIARSRKLASPFGGPALLRQYYKQVPLASFGWAIFRINPAEKSAPTQGTLSFLFSKPAVTVVSARYLGKIHLRADAFTGSEEDAQRVTQQAATFLNMLRSAETTISMQGTDVDVKAFFDGLKVSQNKDRVELTAIVPPGFLRKAVSAPEPEAPTAPPPPITPAAPTQKKQHN